MMVYFRGTIDDDDENWLYNNWTAGSHTTHMYNTSANRTGAARCCISNTFTTLVNQFTM
ncbi:MAG: hypothetical protein LC114_15820 [Bryobacterales bacterium]|nr:hypothetical protein [Bryobacterales bacterium]